MEQNTPIDNKVVSQKINERGLPEVGTATIREIKKLVDNIEGATGEKFIRMEMGIPGLPPTQVGVDAEIAALKKGVAAIYPDIHGIAPLKTEISKFVKNFINVDVSPEGCIPTVGSMQGGFAAFLTVNRLVKGKEKVLFIDPGFPVHKQQLQVIGYGWDSFDVYNYRGDKLRAKLESYLSTGEFSSILYSNPNNPSWICFNDLELEIIADVCKKYGVIVMEDLAYFAMDFRKDLSHPGQAPYQASIANYTDDYILFISSSKAFSYAGQRIGMMVISDHLFKSNFPDLKRFYKTTEFGYSMIYGTLYALSSGTSHSAQYALRAILEAANTGEFDFVNTVKVYGEKAKVMKKLFIDNGFKTVYDQDLGEPIADGFYFTFSYPGLTGVELLNKLVYYGISAISLAITGSDRTEGIRATVSLVKETQFGDLESRLKAFNENNK